MRTAFCGPSCISAMCAALGLSVSAFGQASVDLRVVPRIGDSQVIAGYEGVLDFAVQARVNSIGNAFGLATYGFNIRIVGEPENAGLLQRSSISMFDGTYDPGISTISTVGRGGLARQYTYLAMLSSAFNGRVNASSGTFTNGPDQEIGLIAGAAAGERLIGTPGIDGDGDGIPDTLTPSPSVLQTYFGAGEFVDIYRFRYLISGYKGRNFSVQLEQVSGVQVFMELHDAQGLWGTTSIAVGTVNVQGFELYTLPVPGAGATVALAMLVLASRRRPRNTPSA